MRCWRGELRSRIRACVFQSIAVLATLSFSVAASGKANSPTITTSSDQRLQLVLGERRDDILAAVNDVAEDGYRLVAASTTARIVGSAGLACLLEKCTDGDATEHQYAFVQGMTAKRLGREIRELADLGFRIPSWGLLARWADYIEAAAPKAFVVMERSGEAPVRDYHVVDVAMGRKRLIATTEQACENGDRLIGLHASGRAAGMTFWERLPATQISDDTRPCDGRYEYVSHPNLRKLMEQLAERGNEGYRLLAASGLGLLLERPGDPPQVFSYRFPCTPRDPCEEAVATMNAWASEGFRLWPSSPYFIMVKDHDPETIPAIEYRLIGPAPAHELLDALSEARANGFRIIDLLGDDAVLLER